MRFMLASLPVIVASANVAPLHVEKGCGNAARLSTSPKRPTRGTMFVVRVTGVPAESDVSGRVAGEALHLLREPSGAFSSLAPAPIDSSTILVVVSCGIGKDADTLRLRVALAKGTYRISHLRVAPRFSVPPDSAIAARQQREAARAAQVSTVAHETKRLWSGAFMAPRSSRITSRFGSGREFNGIVTARHMGTDYAGAVGAPIRAANRGVVRLVDDFFLGGKVVYIDHGAGVVTAYMHMSMQRVAAGDTVERGAVLGLVGATGRVTGPHLHFIVRYGAVSVDPQSLLDSVPRIEYVPSVRRVLKESLRH